MIEFKVPSIGKAEAWCIKYVGPRLYYIHDKIGGEGWSIIPGHKNSETLLCLEDNKKAIMAMLMLVE